MTQLSRLLDEMESQPERITKLAGAERLLKTAVDLFFEDGDMLSIHVLSSAAHEVLHVLLKKERKLTSFMKDIDLVIRSIKIKKYHDIIHHTQNFLKHGAKDHNAKLEYYKAETPFWIFDAIQMYAQLTGSQKYKVFALFVLWFRLEHKEVFDEQALTEMLKHAPTDAQFVKDNYEGMLEDPNQIWLAQLS